MGIRPQFNQALITKALRDFEKEVENKVTRILSYMGEKCVSEARMSGSYQDRTANLRASAGYLVLFNGKTTSTQFSTGEGGDTALKLAREIAAGYPEGSVLIVVSGMKYAAYVEAKGYNVLTTAEQLAERELPKLLQKLK